VNQANWIKLVWEENAYFRSPLNKLEVTPPQLREMAAYAGIRAASICECLANGCMGGLGCKTQHPACPEALWIVWRAAQDLRRQGTWLPSKRVKFIEKYMDHFVCQYGQQDEDVLALAKSLKTLVIDEKRKFVGIGGP